MSCRVTSGARANQRFTRSRVFCESVNCRRHTLTGHANEASDTALAGQRICTHSAIPRADMADSVRYRVVAAVEHGVRWGRSRPVFVRGSARQREES